MMTSDSFQDWYDNNEIAQRATLTDKIDFGFEPNHAYYKNYISGKVIQANNTDELNDCLKDALKSFPSALL
jgi:hypothetical protein